jgi:hypothetical protein
MRSDDSDDQLAGTLTGLIADLDPVPPQVLAAASGSLAWRDPDAALAVLIADSATAEPAGIRGEPPRLVTFEAGDVTVDLEVTTHTGRVRAVGQLAPPQPAQVSIEHLRGAAQVVADRLGRFVVEDLPVGHLRVRVTGADRRAICTEWFVA